MRIYPVFLENRGCQQHCLFCNQSQVTSGTGLLTGDLLHAKLDRMLPEQGDGEIAFFGGSFTLLPDELQTLCLDVANDYVRAGRVAGIRLSTRPDGLSCDRLIMLADAGVTTIEVGCQSFDGKVLQETRRGHSTAEIVSAAVRCRQQGFRLGLQLMPGLPGGDADEAERSLLQALSLEPDFLRIYPTLVMRDTLLAELWERGAYTPWSLDEAVSVCAELLLHCRRAGVPVVRLGMQQDPQLEAGLLAGPYHPAFGQLVRSRLWRRAVEQLSSADELRVNPDDLSDVLGHRAENRSWMRQNRPHQVLRADNKVPRGQLATGSDCWSMESLARKTG